MKTTEAIHLFGGTCQSLANVLGISRAAVSQWGENVPPLREYQLREMIERREKVGNQERQKAA